MEQFQPDGAIRFAAIHFIPYCMSHPDETFATNVRGTELVLRALERTPARKIVFASTMDVYAPLDLVHREVDQPSPVNAYGLSKLLGEHLLAYATRTNDKLSAVALRFANAFGPGETNPHLIPDALDRMRDRSQPEIKMGYLGATRDFIHVSDIADAAIAALFKDTGRFEVFNVASSIPTPVRHVVETISAWPATRGRSSRTRSSSGSSTARRCRPTRPRSAPAWTGPRSSPSRTACAIW